MANSKTERRLSPELGRKIASLDKDRPYVWRLRLTEADFQALEACLAEVVATSGGDSGALLTKEWAMPTVVYLAEWYKRRYAGGDTHCVTGFDTEQLKQLWQVAGLNRQTLLYRDEAGHRRWLYSLYVLGGLAVRHEVGRRDSGPFLSALCRIYHGEEPALENLEDRARAAAFRESIRRGHSLHAFMQELLSGRMPFAHEDAKTGDVSRFITALKRANDEVLRQKFRLEWTVPQWSWAPESDKLLRLCLCPEETGQGLHQYLSYERLRGWGLQDVENEQSLRVAVSFALEGAELAPANWQKPLIVYSNTGREDTGFLSWGVERGVTLRQMPQQPFSHVWVWLKTAGGQTARVAKLETPLFRTGNEAVVLRRHDSLIAYGKGGTITHHYEDEEGPDTEQLPLIFGLADITSPHTVEWKQANGQYTPWTGTNPPPHGTVGLRLTHQGRSRLLTVAHLPGLDDGLPLERDCAKHQIRYANMQGGVVTVQDRMERNGEPLDATLVIRTGTEEDYYELPVFRPTRQKEVCVDGRVVAYRDGMVVLPYIIKGEATLRVFGEEGFRSYACEQLRGLYDVIKRESGMGRHDYCKHGITLPAKHLDANAPECLQVALGVGVGVDPIPADTECHTWDYDPEHPPTPCDYATAPARNTIVFQSKARLTGALTCLPTKRNFSPFGYRKMPLLCCFETAVRHRLYFYDLEPMTRQDARPDVWRTDVYEPLEARGPLCRQHLLGLQRLAEEMGFGWEELGVDLQQQQENNINED